MPDCRDNAYLSHRLTGKRNFTKMRYLITQGQFSPPFFTDNFDPENHWQEHVDMVVYDLNCSLYTIDGKEWKPIAIDGL